MVQVFRILFDLPRSLIWNKYLLLHANPYKTLKNVNMKESQNEKLDYLRGGV